MNMKKYALTLAVLLAGMNLLSAPPQVIPELCSWVDDASAMSYKLPAMPRLVLEPNASDTLRDYVKLFADEIDASISLINDQALGDIKFIVKPGVVDHPEGYRLTISPHKVTIEASTDLGAYWATRTLLQVFQNNQGVFPAGVAEDWPKYKVRGFMFDCGRKPFALSTLRALVDICSYYKMNDLQLHLSDNYIWLHRYEGVKTAQDVLNLDPSPSAFRLESKVEGLTSKDLSYSKEEFKELLAYARQRGVKIVPELDVPGHALALVRVRPDLMYRGSVGHKNDCERAAMLDLDNPETFDFVASIFDEYIDEGIFTEDVIHIGTDEYYGDAERYRAFTDKLLKHIIAKGKTPRFWGSLRAKKGETPVHVKDTQMHIWSLDWQDPRKAVEDGYEIINILDVYSYVVPNGTGNVGAYGDDINARVLYENWTPGSFRRGQWDCSIDPNHPKLLGAAWAVWNDNSFMTDPGLCGRDLLPMIHKNCAVLAQRTWAAETTRSYESFLEIIQQHAKVLDTEKPATWEKTFTVTASSTGPQCLAETDEVALYAIDPTAGCVGFRREGDFYTFDVKLTPGEIYDITFKSSQRKAEVTIRAKEQPDAQPMTYSSPKRQYFPNACRYFTLPPLP